MMDQNWINIVDDEPDQLPDFLRNPDQAPSRESSVTWRIVDLALTSAPASAARLGRDLGKSEVIKMIRSAGSMFVPSKP